MSVSTEVKDTLGPVELDWSKASDGSTYDYLNKVFRVQRRSNEDSTFRPLGIDYKSIDEVKCLQIYPHPNCINQMKNWVELSGYGQGIIKIDSVSIEDYNANPQAYLQDSNGDWKYQVIFFGTWDSNNSKGLSDLGFNWTEKFIRSGRGCIFGHDTMSWTYTASGPATPDRSINFNKLAKYVNIVGNNIFGSGASYPYGNTLRISKYGVFTEYPNNIGGVGTILTIPTAHTVGQSAHGDVWLRFTGASNDSLNNVENFYLTTYKNCAMIQTGHSNGAATPDEQKILANIIFYCNQLMMQTTHATDETVKDITKPENPQLNRSSGFLYFSAKDKGTNYEYYVEAFDKNNTAEDAVIEKSSSVFETIKSGVSSYRYVVDNNPNTTVKIDDTEVEGIETSGEYDDLESKIDLEDIQDYTYVHVAAVDREGNISNTTTIEIPHEADYNIENYLEKVDGNTELLDDNNYVYKETVKGKGVIFSKDLPTDEDIVEYRSYTYKDHDNHDGHVSIKANGTSTVKMFYKRIRYNIVYSPGESFATGETQSQNIKWGEEFKIRENGFTKEYTYNLDLNGGSLPEDITDTKLIEKHTFKNWHYNSGDIDGRIDSGDYIENQVISSEEQHFTVNDADNITLEAVWEPGKIKLPNVTKDGADFIGWFNVPQEMGNTGVKAKLLGKANEEVTLEDLDRKGIQDLDANNEFTLYAWFNKRPVFVNLYDGLFFEGQDVDYKDLLELVGVWDYDDDYEDIASDKVNEHFNSLKEVVDNDIEDVRDDIYYIEEADRESGDDSTSELKELRERLAKLFTERQKIESTRRELLKGIKTRKLEPVIANIKYIDGESEFDYHSDEVSSNGLKIATRSNAEHKLDTKTENIGRVEITYQVHDEGIYYKDWTHVDDLETSEEDEEISEENLVFVEGSKITMEYTRKCQINFNYNPLLNLQNMLYYTDYDFGDSLSDFVMSRQIVRDSEDLQDNIPWWSKKADTKNLLLHKENENTIDKLQKTLVITSVGDEISFNTVFENEFKGATEKFRDEIKQNEVYSEKELLDYMYSFKNDPEVYWKDGGSEVKKSDIWDNLTSISITFDGCDQFGKCASNNVSEYGIQKGVKTDTRPKGYKEEFNSGYKVSDDMTDYDISIYQTDYERTVYLMLINLNNDSDLSHVRVKDRIRYISKDYLDTLEGSFWGTEGLVEIEKALGKAEVPGDNYTDRAGSYNDIKVNIKDYTE